MKGNLGPAPPADWRVLVCRGGRSSGITAKPDVLATWGGDFFNGDVPAGEWADLLENRQALA